MPVRERGQGEPTPGQHVPFSGHVQALTPGERRAFAPAATEDTGERDSPLEGAGFEPLVPLGEPPVLCAYRVPLRLMLLHSGSAPFVIECKFTAKPLQHHQRDVFVIYFNIFR